MFFSGKRVQATLFVLLSVGLFAMTSVLAKLLGSSDSVNQLHPFQISSARFIFGFITVFTYTLFVGVSFINTPWRLHGYRSVAGWLGVSCLFAAAARIPLADANAISFLSVIVTMALSVYVLGERVGIKRWSAAAIGLSGALLIARPGSSAFDPAALIAMMAAVFIGAETILIKILSDREQPLRILLINNLIGALISCVVLVFVWQDPVLSQWPMLFMIGFIMVLAQLCNILALKRDEASYVVPFWYAAPLFAAIYDYLLFAEIVSPWSAVGIILIVASGIVITRRSQQAG